MTWAQALAVAVARLRAAGVDEPARDARLLLAEAAGCGRDRLVAVLADPADPVAAARFQDMIAARAARQPVSQILGRRAFYGRDFQVTRDVLDPRPETELLVDLALSAPFDDMLDLGTGSGAILLSCLGECPEARGLGSDVSPAALEVARANAHALGLEARARFALSDWWQGIAGRFDLVVSNPPYIAAHEMAALAPEVRDWEPHGALTPGGDGLAAYRSIAAGALGALRPGGRLLVEIGARQGAAVHALFSAAGLEQIRVHPDLDGRDRVVAGQAPQGST